VRLVEHDLAERLADRHQVVLVLHERVQFRFER
jgi:hypothetical protein